MAPRRKRTSEQLLSERTAYEYAVQKEQLVKAEKKFQDLRTQVSVFEDNSPTTLRLLNEAKAQRDYLLSRAPARMVTELRSGTSSTPLMENRDSNTNPGSSTAYAG